MDSLISFAPFDNWIRGTNYNHTEGQDGIVDMIFMLYGNVSHDDSTYEDLGFYGGTAWLGFAGEIWVDEDARRIQGGTVRSGFTVVLPKNLNVPPYYGSVHELGHFFFPASNS